ncbi:uncharacterized protein LOC125233624 [Leguminivora glycinivorella]|uniref:uncharacterized protein LOC125233624 n=1 Tax=Leguminivora glycinivorella TaxID=1035111 RepID=UPI00200E22FA|nr:uncharacterized protein LOC125233624 [Leguminivora glycinivorella]
MSLAVAFLTTVLLPYALSTLIVDPNGYQYEVGTFIPNDGVSFYPEPSPPTYQPITNILEVPQVPEQRNSRQLQPSPPKVPTDTSHITKNLNSEINDIIESLNQLTENRMTENRMDENMEARAAERADEYGHRLSYGYPSSPQNYGPWSPSYVPQYKHEQTPKLSLLKPDLLVKPVATKAASKISGLIELVLALLSGSASNDLELKGFKDIVINGIVKPLLTAKGGLKSLISKLSIPVISLLLINLEVLITIWWLWEEDCPQPVYHHPSYGYAPKPSYHATSYPTPSYPTQSYPSQSYPSSYNYNPYK